MVSKEVVTVLLSEELDVFGEDVGIEVDVEAVVELDGELGKEIGRYLPG